MDSSGIDFVSLLPIDVVEHILSFVDVADTLKCIRVSKQWYSLLTSSRLELYWKGVCLHQLGLTKARLRDYQRCYPLVKIASSALRHHKWICGFMSKVDKLDKGKDSVECRVSTAELFRFPRRMNVYPQDNLTRPSCFIGHNFVLCSPLFFREPHLTIATVSPMTKTMFASNRDPLRTCLERPRQSWVFWCKASVNYILLLIQPEGRWIGYCPVTSKIVLDVTNSQAARVLLTGGCTAVASCERCFQLVTFKAVNDEAATWDLTFLKMGRPLDDGVVLRTSSVVCTKSMVVKLKSNECVMEWKFLSMDQVEKGAMPVSGHYCSSHQLVCVTNSKIHIYRCTFKGNTINKQTTSEETQTSSDEELLTGFTTLKVGEIVIPDSPLHTRNPDTGLLQISSIKSSLDGSLLGIIVKTSHLYVWDLPTQEVISTTNLSNLLAPKARPTSGDAVAPVSEYSCRLLAVGHHCSVVAVFDDKPGGQICIIATTSGKLLTRRDSRVQWVVHEEKDYIHLVNEEWLSDIFCYNAPFFTYLNRSLSLGSHAQALSCVHFMPQSQAKIIL